jgi:CDP-glucose 4,6-dehydratase
VANRVDSGPPEAGILRLDSTRARAELGWQPAWSLGQALERTVAWQRAWLGGEDMRSFSEAQIGAHSGVPIP